jgi:hypothetical protein
MISDLAVLQIPIAVKFVEVLSRQQFHKFNV